jgi:SAM-dependent methyltransferase
VQPSPDDTTDPSPGVPSDAVRDPHDDAYLRRAWQQHARQWIAWARTPMHDSYWRFHRDQFLSLLPDPTGLTLDVGAGEGRLTRELAARGHRVVAVDGAPAMATAAHRAAPDIPIAVADAAALPLRTDLVDLVIAFMSLHDIDDMAGAVSELARVLRPGGRLCAAIVHPLNSAGRFDGDRPDAPFVVEGSYLDSSVYRDDVARDELTMAFISAHRPLSAYATALADAGMLIECLREPAVPDHAVRTARDRRWQRVPLFLHIRARLPGL